MQIIQNISANARQSMNIVLDDGTSFFMLLYFRPMQKGWFIEQLTYGDVTIRNLRIVVSPNFLYQWRNVLPFGLACFSTASREPSLIQDFSSGDAKLYILSAAEMAAFTEYLET